MRASPVSPRRPSVYRAFSSQEILPCIFVTETLPTRVTLTCSSRSRGQDADELPLDAAPLA